MAASKPFQGKWSNAYGDQLSIRSLLFRLFLVRFRICSIAQGRRCHGIARTDGATLTWGSGWGPFYSLTLTAHDRLELSAIPELGGQIAEVSWIAWDDRGRRFERVV